MSDEDLIWKDDLSPSILEGFLKKQDYGNAGKLLDHLVSDLDKTGRLINAKSAKKTLSLLRNFAWFEKLKAIAEKFEEHAQNDPVVLLLIAQARIELGEITLAIESLFKLKDHLEEKISSNLTEPISRKESENNLSETLGLLGRSYKQLYINSRPVPGEPRKFDLEKSLNFYSEAFNHGIGDQAWHGVNIIALQTHHERVRTNRANAITTAVETTARKIIELSEAIDERRRQSYDWANLIEAYLALGQTEKAIAFVEPYLNVADRFAIQSTRRQLTEIWMLNESRPPGDQILPLMTARFLELGGHQQEETRLDTSLTSTYEKVWGSTKYQSIQWMLHALERAKSVARIGPNKYEGDGTGFLFDGTWVDPSWAGRKLLLTNAHVCSDDPEVMIQHPFPSPPEDLTATFLGTGKAEDAEEIEISKLVWTSPPSELDATLVELSRIPAGCIPPPITRRDPPVTMAGDARLNILGHPKGLDLRISLQDNEIVGIGEKYIHYRTPTDPGSSGSPVFNQKWDLVALHHASSAAHKANEGVRMDMIINSIREEFFS